MSLPHIKPQYAFGLLGYVLCAVAGYLIGPELADEIASEVIALFGLMMAAVLPTMILTATVLRAGSMSVKKIQEYGNALEQQMRVWIGLFAISFFTCLLVILGRAAGFDLRVELPSVSGVQFPDLPIGDLLRILIGLGVGVMVTRVLSVGRGVMSLLTLNVEIAVGEARKREQEKFSKQFEKIKSIPNDHVSDTFVDIDPSR